MGGEKMSDEDPYKKDPRLAQKRQNLTDCATIPTRLLDQKTFPKVAAALKLGAVNNTRAAGKRAFDEICADTGVPKGAFTDYLWTVMLDADNKIANMPGWIPGSP